MANKIYINTDIYAHIADRLMDLSHELSECAASLSHVDTDRAAGGQLRIHLGGCLASTGDALPSGWISSCVRSLRQIICELRDHTSDAADSVRQAMNLFEAVEAELSGMELRASRPAVFTNGRELAFAIGVGASILGEAVSDRAMQTITDGDAALAIGGDFAELIIGGIPIAACVGGLANPGAVSLIAPLIGRKPLIGDPNAVREMFESSVPHSLSDLWTADISVQAGGTDDLGRNDFEHVSPLADRLSAGTISAGIGGSTSVWSAERTDTNGGLSASVTADLLKVSGEIGASAGLYAMEVAEDGSTSYRLSPGAEARIGASAAAFEAGASANYELIDGVDVHTSVTGTVGEATANAEAKIGIVDGEVNLYAGAELEAIAGEVTGDVGINVAGVDGTVSASLNYGIGAHAEAGLEDGVFKVDVGVSVGVGGSIGFELDVGEALDNVVDAITGFSVSAWNYFT